LLTRRALLTAFPSAFFASRLLPEVEHFGTGALADVLANLLSSHLLLRYNTLQLWELCRFSQAVNEKNTIMSPTVKRYQRFRFFFFSREEERKHIHVESPEGEAKFWLEPAIELVMNQGIRPQDITVIENFITENYDEFIDAWTKHFGH
jgi:hypothetical protein